MDNGEFSAQSRTLGRSGNTVRMQLSRKYFSITVFSFATRIIAIPLSDETDLSRESVSLPMLNIWTYIDCIFILYRSYAHLHQHMCISVKHLAYPNKCPLGLDYISKKKKKIRKYSIFCNFRSVTSFVNHKFPSTCVVVSEKSCHIDMWTSRRRSGRQGDTDKMMVLM